MSDLNNTEKIPVLNEQPDKPKKTPKNLLLHGM